MRCIGLGLLVGLVGCGAHGLTKLDGASVVGGPAALEGAPMLTLISTEIEKRSAALGACFAGPTNVAHRTSVTVAIRGPLHEEPGAVPGAYGGWGRPDAVFYVGQLPEHPGAPQPPDDEFNRCIAGALEKIPFPVRETKAIDATWVIRQAAPSAIVGSR